jgi:hypothetical protein
LDLGERLPPFRLAEAGQAASTVGHGGEVDVKSKVGEGASFTVRLPVTRQV